MVGAEVSHISGGHEPAAASNPAQFAAAEVQGTAAPLQAAYEFPPAHPLHPPTGPHLQAPTQLTPATWNLGFSGQDVRQWFRDGVILVAVALAVGFVVALLVGVFLPSGDHGNPAGWFSTGLLFVGMALGGRITSTSGFGGAATGSDLLGLGGQASGRVSLLLLAIAVLFTARLLARRAERAKLSASLKELTLRSLGTTGVFIGAMAILALLVHMHSFYGDDFGASSSAGNDPNSITGLGAITFNTPAPVIALSSGSMLVWPLFLIAAVTWSSAFGLWLRTCATTAPHPTAEKLAWLWTCRPAFLAVRAQVVVTMVVAGVGAYVYAVIHTLQSSSQQGASGPDMTRVVLGLLLALPNLGALAGSVSLGAPITGLAGYLGQNAVPTPDDSTTSAFNSSVSLVFPSAKDSLGFFGDVHPGILYALILASVIGAVVGAKWTLGKNWDRGRALLGPGQAWRGAVLGAVLWTTVGFAAQMSLDSELVPGAGVDMVIGPSLAGLVLAGAIWGLVTCLLLSFFAGHVKSVPRPVLNPGPGSAALSDGEDVLRPGGQQGSVYSSAEEIDGELVITLAPPEPPEPFEE